MWNLSLKRKMLKEISIRKRKDENVFIQRYFKTDSLYKIENYTTNGCYLIIVYEYLFDFQKLLFISNSNKFI